MLVMKFEGVILGTLRYFIATHVLTMITGNKNQCLAGEGLLQVAVDSFRGERVEKRLFEGEGGELFHASGFCAVHAGDLVVFASQFGANLVGGAQQVVTGSGAGLSVLFDLLNKESLDGVELFEGDGGGAKVARHRLPDQSAAAVQKTGHHLWKHDDKWDVGTVFK